MAAVRVTLLAFAAERRAVPRAAALLLWGPPPAMSIDLLPAGRPAANPPHAPAAVDRWDSQTDRRTDTHRYIDPVPHTTRAVSVTMPITYTDKLSNI